MRRILIIPLIIVLSACSVLSPGKVQSPHFTGQVLPSAQVTLDIHATQPAAVPTGVSTPEINPGSLPDGKAIEQLLWLSHTHWERLWVDVEIHNFTPDGHSIPENTWRVQLWLDQPGKGKLLSGLVGGKPERLWTSDGKAMQEIGEPVQILEQNLGDFNPPYPGGDAISGHPLGGRLNSPVSDMIFSTSLGQRGGYYTPITYETYAGRQVWVVEWARQPGELVDRFWVDALTGVILRWQNFTKGANGPMTAHMFVNQIIFEPQFSPGAFQVGQSLPSDYATGP